MGRSRAPAALDFLFEVLETGDVSAAAAAVPALAVHRHNPAVRDRVAAAVAGKGAVLKKAFAKEFGEGE